MIGGRIGSIADYDPMNENYGSLAQGYKPASRQTSVVKDGDDDGFDGATEIKSEKQDEDKDKYGEDLCSVVVMVIVFRW